MSVKNKLNMDRHRWCTSLSCVFSLPLRSLGYTRISLLFLFFSESLIFLLLFLLCLGLTPSPISISVFAVFYVSFKPQLSIIIFFFLFRGVNGLASFPLPRSSQLHFYRESVSINSKIVYLIHRKVSNITLHILHPSSLYINFHDILMH